MSNFNAQPNQLQQSTMHVSSTGGMIVSGVQNPSIVTGSYSVSSQSSLNVVGQMSLLSSLGQAHQISNQGVYLRQGQITSNNIIMRSPAPSPVSFGATHSPGVLLRSPAPSLTSPLRSPAPYLTPSPSPSIPPSPSPGPISRSPSHSTQNFTTFTSLDAPSATLVGSNNFPLNIHSTQSGNVKKTIKRVIGKPITVQKSAQKQQALYQQVNSVCSSNANMVANASVSPKQIHRSGGLKTPSPHVTLPLPSASPNSQNNTQAKSPIASPNTVQMRTPTTQPILQQTFQQVPVQMNANNQLVQIIQGSQIIGSRQQVIIPSTTSSQSFGAAAVISGKQKPPQQILPKPANAIQSTAPAAQNKITKTHNNTQHQSSGQIILPGNMNNQPLLLNQMPVLVQQNTAQGVQLILRPPVPPSTPGLLIHNARPQMHQPQQLLRILNGMQIAAPTFIVSSQQNMQQNISLQQHIQSNIAQGQIKNAASNIHISNQNVQQPQRQMLNSHIISQNVSSMNNTNLQAHLQNLQINGNLAHIQVPNGLNGQFIGQIPTQFQTNLTGLGSLATNINDLHQFSNAEIQTSKANINNMSNVITAPTLLQQKVVVSTSSLNQNQSTAHDSKQSHEQISGESSSIDNEQSVKDSNDIKGNSRSKKPKKTKKVKGKLDLANLMKLSGIMEDDDLNFLDTNVTSSNEHSSNLPTNASNEQVIVQLENKQSVSNEDIPMMIALPNRMETSYTLAENEDNGSNKTANALESVNQNLKSNQTNLERVPYMITIQNSAEGNAEPYTISVPNLSTNAIDSLEMSDSTNENMNSISMSKSDENDLKSIDSSTAGLCVPSFVNNAINSTVITPTLQSQINEIQNHLMGFSQSANKTASNKRKAVKKPVKKPECSEASKNQENSNINPSDNSAYINIPSQIGNIQISQVDIPVSVKNGQNILNRNIDNHIQIMPIIENTVVNNSSNSINQTLTVPYSTSGNVNIPVDQSNIVEWMNSYLARPVPAPSTLRVNQPDVGVNTLLGISTPEGFVGGLSLSLSEDGRIVLHQDNRQTIPDLQSQLLLHNLISNTITVTCEGSQSNLIQSQPVSVNSSLPNVTHDNIKYEPVTKCVNSVTSIATPKISTKPLGEAQKQMDTLQSQNIQNFQQHRMCFGENTLNKNKNNPAQQHSIVLSESGKSIMKPVAVPITKLVELPKIGPNQQLFSLNTATDQITQLNPTLTTAALGPTEQLLIVPTGINAEQLAQCLLQGQIHFNNISGVPSSNNVQSQSHMHDSAMRQLEANMDPSPQITHSTRICSDNVNKETHIKTDEYKDKSKKKCKSTFTLPSEDKSMKQFINVKTSLHDHLTNKQISVQNMDNMISQKASMTSSCNISTSIPYQCHAQVPPLVNVSVQSGSKPLENIKQNSGPCLPQLVPIPTEELSQHPPNFIPRIQTIQLTPQKQQLLKNVQLQIQALSAKLQNKNSLANLSIPILDGVSNATTTAVQPNLSLSDSEIHLALQNLFIEQQKILATGKVIPTIPGQHANFQLADNNSNKTIQQATQHIPISQTEDNLSQKDSQANRWEIKVSHGHQPSSCATTPSVVKQNNTINSQMKCISNQNTSPNIVKNNLNRNNSPYNIQMCTQTNTSVANNPSAKLQLPSTSSIRMIKQPVVRSSLFEQQLSVDQAGAINPDVNTRFMSKSDSCKRLIRYHCLNTPIEVESDVSEEMFELRGRHFLNKFQGMVNKYQQLLMKESMRCVPTSELMMIDRMFVAEEQQELDRVRRECTQYNLIDTTHMPDPAILNNNESLKHAHIGIKSETNYITSNNSKNIEMEAGNPIKNEMIKNETENSSELYEIRKHVLNSPQNIITKTESVKNENIDPFDIESEIMPSFILKKCETTNSNCDVIKTDGSDFESALDQEDKSNGQSKSIKNEQLKADTKSEPYDEWFCIQKELGYIQEKSKQDKKCSDTIDNQMNEIFQNKSDQMVNALFDQPSKMSPLPVENNQMSSRIDDIFKDNSKLFDSETGMSVETKLEALFRGTSQIESDKPNLEKSILSCEGTSHGERNFNKLMNTSEYPMNSPKRPWNGEAEYTKRHCVNDENKRIWPDSTVVTYSHSHQYDNSKRLWNGDGVNDSKRMKHDAASNQKPKKNILHDLERDLLGLDHIDNNLNSSLTSNFDEDINAQVQSAIDSILNLQSAEATGHQLFMPGSETCMNQFLLDPQEHQVSSKKTQKPSSKVLEDNANRMTSSDTGLDEAVKSILKS